MACGSGIFITQQGDREQAAFSSVDQNQLGFVTKQGRIERCRYAGWFRDRHHQVKPTLIDFNQIEFIGVCSEFKRKKVVGVQVLRMNFIE